MSAEPVTSEELEVPSSFRHNDGNSEEGQLSKKSASPPRRKGSKSDVSRSSRKSKHGSHLSHSKSRSKSPDDDLLVLSERHHHRARRSTQKPRSRSTDDNTLLGSHRSRRSHKRSSKSPRRTKSTMSSSPIRSDKLNLSDDDLALGDERSSSRRKSSKSPRRSKSTMSGTSPQRSSKLSSSNDGLALSERSSGGRRRSSQRPRRKSTMSSSSTQSKQLSLSDDDRLAVSERSSKSPHRRRSTKEEDRVSKRKARLAASAAPGAFRASDDEDDKLLGSERSSRRPRSSRQSKLDKDAKRRARSLSLSSGGDFSVDSEEEDDEEMALKLANARYGASSGPGAIYASNQARSREARKSDRHSTGSKRRSSSQDFDMNGDEKAKRKARHSARATMPGVSQATSIDMAARKHDRKLRKSSMMDGVVDDLSDSDEEQQALRLAGARYEGRNSIGARMRTSKEARMKASMNGKKNGNKKSDGDAVAHAITVDEDGDGTEPQEAQEEENELMIRGTSQMTDDDIEQHRQRVREQNENNRREREADIKQKADEKRKKRNRFLIILFALLVLAGTVIYFLLRRTSSTAAAFPVVTETEAPVSATDGSEEPSIAPSDSRTNSPTIYLKYDPPDAKDCENIAAGILIDVPEDSVVNRNFDVIMEVDLVDNQALEPVLPVLETKIEEILMPRLAGCPDGNEVERRRLQQNQAQNIRNVIADGVVAVRMSNDLECGKIQSDNCSVVITNLDLRLLGDEMVLFIVGIISEVFHVNSPNPLVEVLDLNNPYLEVVVVMVTNNDPTAAPTTGAPSDTPSVLPSSIPSAEPSLIPTPFPSIAPFPGSTSSPTCPSIATSFDSQSFLERSGTQDASYTVSCGTGSISNLAVLRRLGSSCEVGCVADLAFTVFEPVCNQAGSVDVTLTGDYSQSTLYIGLLDSATSYQCTDTLQLDTPSPSLTPSTFPSESPSQSPTIFPTPTPTVAPILEEFTPAPVVEESSQPTIGESMQPSLSSAPTSRYVGCYADDPDDPDFFLKHHIFYSQSGDVDSCITECSDFGFSYAALQFDEIYHCFCGNTFGEYGISTSCSGDCGGECGGQGVNSVYRTNVQQARPEEELPEGLECDCYQDNAEEPDLPYEYGLKMSQQACILGCKSLQFSFAGLSEGGSCRCGNDPGTHGLAWGEEQGGCYMSCDANGIAACYGYLDSCTCGGFSTNQVFRTNLSVDCPSQETETPQTVAPDEDTKDPGVPPPTVAPVSPPTVATAPPPTVAPVPPPTVAPVPPPTVAPVPPPTVAPVPPPTVAPVPPPTVAPVPPPTVAPVPPPTVAPVPPPTVAPVTSPPLEAPSPSQPPPLEDLIDQQYAYVNMSSSTLEMGEWYAIDGDNCEEQQQQQQCPVAETLFSQTQMVYPWWELDLGFTASVHKVVVWSGNYPLEATMLQLLDEYRESAIATASLFTGTSRYQEITFENADGVRYLRLEGMDPFLVMSIAEVEVYGYRDDPEPTF